MKRIIVCFVFVICGGALCNAQLGVSTAGGDVSGNGGRVSYTIGQVTYSNSIEHEGTVTQGVQQPYEIFVISSIGGDYGIYPEFIVYPNPTNKYLKLVSVNYTTGNIAYQLYDVKGKLVENKKLDSVETNIQMDMLVPSVYFLKVIDDHKVVKTFKIIKK